MEVNLTKDQGDIVAVDHEGKAVYALSVDEVNCDHLMRIAQSGSATALTNGLLNAVKRIKELECDLEELYDHDGESILKIMQLEQQASLYEDANGQIEAKLVELASELANRPAPEPQEQYTQVGIKHRSTDGRTEFLWFHGGAIAEGSPIYVRAVESKQSETGAVQS